MALVTCPECSKKGVSSSAPNCPSCGFELKGKICKECGSSSIRIENGHNEFGIWSTAICNRCGGQYHLVNRLWS